MPKRNRNSCLAVRLTLVVLAAASACAAVPGEPLRAVREVLALSSDVLAQKPAVHLRGVVTYFKAEGIPDLVVQDETGGIFVGQGERESGRALKAGMVVEVVGTAGPGNFSPSVQSTRAVKRALALKLAWLAQEQSLTKSEMAARMKTSRAAVDRLLDADNPSVTLATLGKAARALGCRVKIELVPA